MKNDMQVALFHERIEDALDEVIRCCGGRKSFAAELWPAKPERDRHNLIDACLNPTRPEKFSPAQVLFIARRGAEVGCHALMHYFGAECGYEVKPFTKAEEIDRVASIVDNAAQVLAAGLATIERLKRSAPSL